MVQMFCKCHYNHISRDMVFDHQATMYRNGQSGHGPIPGHIYQVGHTFYYAWAKTIGWRRPPQFPDCNPTLSGGEPTAIKDWSPF